MSLWICPKHGLYGGQVFCPQCGGGGEYATFPASGSDAGKPTDTIADLASQVSHWRIEHDLERERADRLAAALEPFDDALGEDDEFPDETPVTMRWGRTTYYALDLGHLRAARAARHG